MARPGVPLDICTNPETALPECRITFWGDMASPCETGDAVLPDGCVTPLL